jgi:diacylglycerol kinase (ATP)
MVSDTSASRAELQQPWSPRESRLLVLINRHSRSGATAAGSAIARLSAAGFKMEVFSPDCPTEVSPWIEAHARDAAAVVVAGGDGSLNAAAPALARTKLALGILPTGTANDLARTLGLPLAVEAAADVIAAGHRRQIDVGEVNGHLFFNVASVGLSSELARQLNRETKRRFGRLSYFITTVKILSGSSPFRAVIVSPGEVVRVRTLQIAVGNGRYYGGGLAVEHTAEIDDAHLDLYSLELSGIWKLIAMAKDFRLGRHGAWREVRAARGASFEVRTRRPRAVNTDGELVTFTPARFSVRPKSVTVIVPSLSPSWATDPPAVRA